MHRFFVVPFLALVTGCYVDLAPKESPPPPPPPTFEYSSSQCPFGCPLTQSVVAGSMITITGHSPPEASALTARLSDPSLGHITNFSPSCGPSCDYTVDIETTMEGDETLELVDADLVVKASTTIPIRNAANIILVVDSRGAEIDQSPDAFYEVPLFADISLSATVVDESGSPMVFTKHALEHVYADETIVGHDDVADLYSGTDVEPMRALGKGETQVTVRTKTGAERIAKFRIR